MASNTFRATRKLLERATTADEIRNIVLSMDENSMKENDWPLLVRVISKVTKKYNNNNKKEK